MPIPDKKYLQNAYEYFHVLNITFYLLIAGPLVLFCVAYLQYEGQGGLKPTHQFSALHVALLLGTALSVFFAFRRYRRAMLLVEPNWSFRHKLRYFYQQIRQMYFWFMASNALAALGLYLTGEQLFAGLYAIVLVVFSIHRPTPRRVVRDLRLSKAEGVRLMSEQPYNEEVPKNSEQATEEKDMRAD